MQDHKVVGSELNFVSFGSKKFAPQYSEISIADVLQTECLVDYLLSGNHAIENAESSFDSQRLVLSPIETRAPLRSICPDKRYERTQEFNKT